MKKEQYTLLVTGLLVWASAGVTQVRQTDGAGYQQDFDVFWTTMRDRYAYFAEKTTDWAKVRAVYRPQLAGVDSFEEFVTLLERVVDELYDPHTHLQMRTRHSPRLVPGRADVWTEWIGDRAIITAVRPGFAADSAGVRPGMEVLAVNGEAIAVVAQTRLPRTTAADDFAARNYALRSAVAGFRNQIRRLKLRDEGEVFEVDLPGDKLDERLGGSDQNLLFLRHLEDNIGYIRIGDALGRRQLIEKFDEALEKFRQTKGLIIDLRTTPSGGDFSVFAGPYGPFRRARAGHP